MKNRTSTYKLSPEADARKRQGRSSKVLIAGFLIVLLLVTIEGAAGAAGAAPTALVEKGDVITVLDPDLSIGTTSRLEGWNIKGWFGRPEVEVVETEIGTTLHLVSDSSSTALYSDAEFNLKKYPVMEWKWMVTKLPDGGSAADFAKNDMAIQLFVVIKQWPESMNSRLLGYVWDTTGEAVETVNSPKSINTKYIVLRSGGGLLSQWLSEKRNVYEDYRRIFNEEPPGPATISIMVDSDDTRSSSESYIGDIYLKEPSK
jgi:hypothetical protein